MTADKHLYSLSYTCPIAEEVRIFYIGRTNDPKRREKEHKYNSKSAHEDKYVFIRQLEANHIKWSFDVFKTIPQSDYAQDWEAFYIIKYLRLDHPIKNMKHGDADKIIEELDKDRSISIYSVADVTKYRERWVREQYERSEKLKNSISTHDIDPESDMGKRITRVTKVFKLGNFINDHLDGAKWFKNGTLFYGILFKRCSTLEDSKRVYHLTCVQMKITVDGTSYSDCYRKMSRPVAKQLYIEKEDTHESIEGFDPSLVIL